MNNKLTLVSGAGRGIGEAIAKKFYKEGHNLILLIHEFKHKKKIEKVFDKNRVTYLIGDLKSKKFFLLYGENQGHKNEAYKRTQEISPKSHRSKQSC